ncbi:MAG TPA: glycosyltransferase family 4 protein [Flavobacterium sp.]|nr:glycosyltransferase family 4 protein [Flavobacterium sp.]
MKILMIAIPNHHFFQWTSQLRDSGHEVTWFDINDDEVQSGRIPWVRQVKKWRRRLPLPFRHRIRRHFPSLSQWMEKRNHVAPDKAIRKTIAEVQPDLIHCFEMDLSGVPLIDVLEEVSVPVLYSSWGSDLYQLENRRPATNQHRFLARANYLITDCARDQLIAERAGFAGRFLGVFPANGGIDFPSEDNLPASDRSLIMVKGYDDGVGKAVTVLKALQKVAPEHRSMSVCVYAADDAVFSYCKEHPLPFSTTTIYSRYRTIPNQEILRLMGRSLIHIGNSASDGMPNALLEAMGMGAFPIQSNPGGATAEMVEDGVNGLLIQDPDDVSAIARVIDDALYDRARLEKARESNTTRLAATHGRSKLAGEIQSLYNAIE